MQNSVTGLKALNLALYTVNYMVLNPASVQMFKIKKKERKGIEVPQGVCGSPAFPASVSWGREESCLPAAVVVRDVEPLLAACPMSVSLFLPTAPALAQGVAGTRVPVPQIPWQSPGGQVTRSGPWVLEGSLACRGFLPK